MSKCVIDFVVSSGLMNGMGRNEFRPEVVATRAMIVTVLYRLNGSPEVTEPSTFTDVPEGEWYSDAIAWAQDRGIVLGISETEFAPDDLVTREQFAAMLWRYQTLERSAASDLSGFTDADAVSDWALEAVTWAVSEGLFVGDNHGRLNPTANITRAEFATVMMRYLGGHYDCPIHGGN